MTQIMDKIRKLLRLAESDNENEAESAARIAAKLMREHAVTQSSLSESALLEEDPVGVHAFEVGTSTWRIQLAWAMATHCSVSALRCVRHGTYHPTRENGHGGRFRMDECKRRVYAIGYGHRSDLEVWEYLYDVALREVERAAREHRKAQAHEGWGVSRTEMTHFREGAVSGLRQKLYDQRSAAKDEGPASEALALQSRSERARLAKERANPALGTFSGGIGGSSAGYSAGGKITINPAVRGGGQRMITD